MSELDQILNDYLNRFIDGNRAGRHLVNKLNDCGVGLMPVLDHVTIRTHNVERRSSQFLDLGYQEDREIGVLEFDSWWAKVYRKPGYPAFFIDQAYDDDRGKDSLIPQWVDAHGDECFHHIAVLVENIEAAISSMERDGFRMAGDIVGGPTSDLRQVFTEPETRNGNVYSVLELIERHNGYAGFLPPQADSLMESTRR
ncbi:MULTISPECIES: VOC family protein [unclassified Nitrospina]|uniref:VOC family protein n=1 Tax=unclassified Nitrospina TaxID=2638683 RepID=UPI003F94D12E